MMAMVANYSAGLKFKKHIGTIFVLQQEPKKYHFGVHFVIPLLVFPILVHDVPIPLDASEKESI